MGGGAEPCWTLELPSTVRRCHSSNAGQRRRWVQDVAVAEEPGAWEGSCVLMAGEPWPGVSGKHIWRQPALVDVGGGLLGQQRGMACGVAALACTWAT
jgi:hypothetical protein